MTITAELFAEKIGMVYNPIMLSAMGIWWQCNRSSIAPELMATLKATATRRHDPEWERSDDGIFGQNQRLIEKVLAQ